MNNKFNLERRHYPVLEHYAYLDTSTTGAIPQYACNAICTYLQERTCLGMDIDYYHEQWEYADCVRDEIAAMTGAENGRTIAFGQNSSSLFNFFCNGLSLERGDNVIVYETAFPAMTYQWLNMQQRLGIEVRVAKAADGRIPAESLFQLADQRTKALTVCHVDSGTGYRHDLKKLGHWCRTHGIAFGVDATQSCGAMKIHVQEMEIDFLTSSCYKWLQGVQGLGFAYIAPEFMDKLNQTEMGWANVSDRIDGDPFDLVLSQTACRFENGGLPAPGLYGLSEVIRTYMRLGADDIQQYILELADYLHERVSQVPGLSTAFWHEPEHRSNLVFITFPEELNLSDARLRAAGIRARVQRKDRMRVGIHYYNNRTDIDRLVGYLEQRINKED